MGAQARADYWPTDGWEEASPRACGMDPDLLYRLRAYGDESAPAVHGIAVVRHGYLVWEHYHHGFHHGSYHSVNSVTKSVLSALVGVALREGLLDSLDRRVADLLPAYASLLDDPGKRALTLRHLLRMAGGFPPMPIEEFPRLERPVEAALARPLAHAPGATFQYDDASAHLVSAILARAAGTSVAAFARRALFGPLGIRAEGAARAIREGTGGPHTAHPFGLWGDDADGCAWMVDRQGLHLGGFGLHLTLREMAKLGYLYLRGGRWDDAPIVPPDYVRVSTRPQSAAGDLGYGYLWWVPRHELDPSAFFAAGYGGQYIDVLPALDMVIAIACSLDEGPVETHGRTVSRLAAAAILDHR